MMKPIYAKRIKEILEEKYNIFPVETIPNPKNSRYKVWLYTPNDQLTFALDQIMVSKGDKSNEQINIR